ncbi:alpha-terpineol synthase, chloroplastic-like isoform X2 [Macadamia integrifolia]|uniref:alpha-terpineol synthase, chloroplastic-like isoform X2 n=1 Tax=Macadamia integrifolia TaxID=60698 RepID=UPI001C4F9054|nr:alpha-terpineol synthase, chloroplastic-like isoform X2 [Macadamia integrifolia]
MGGSLGHPRMALHLYILSTPSSSKGFIHCRPLSHQWMISSNIKCLASTHSTELTTYIRRSANYQSSIWDFDFVQSLNSDYKGEAFKRKTKKLKEEVRGTLDDGAMGQLDLLELIDDIERLGLGYLFEEEIKKALDTIVSMEDLAKTRTKESLHATALQFRLLRQHGYEVNQGMFNHLKDEIGNFKATYLADAKGILSLYEASHLAFEGETILEEAKNFTMTALKEIIKGNIEKNLAKQVNHALELPLHWRVPRLEARWYIDIYEKKENSIAALIELAKLDFNIVQVIHQENVADLSRWDIKAIGQLPYYMKICFLALFNSVNEMGYFHLKEHGIDSIPFLKKAWIELCKAYLIEAKWYHNNDKTTLKEYLNNAVITIGNNVVFIHSFFSLQQTIREEELDCVSQYPSLFYWTSMIVRLANDLSTSMAELERGDVLKSIQSYMYQTGASKEVACEYIRNMIDETWKKINNDLYTNDFLLPQPFIETMVNHARMSLCMYQYGDGHGVIDDESIHRANLLLFEPIPLLRDA